MVFLAEVIPWLPAQLVVYVGVVLAAIVSIIKIPIIRRPFRYVWTKLVSVPVTTWTHNVVGSVVNDNLAESIVQMDDVKLHQAELLGLVTTLGDNHMDINASLKAIHDCMDRRFTESHQMIEKLSLFTEEILTEATGAKERIRQLYRSLDVPVFESDKNGHFLYVNPAYSLISGLSAEETLGEGWVESLHPEDRSRIFKAWDSAVSNHIDFNAIYRYINILTKETVNVKGHAKPLHDGRGLVVGYIGTLDVLPA